MTLNIAINGFGRIGRNVVRAIFESNRTQEFNIVAINDPGKAEVHAHLLQFDTAHGRFQSQVQLQDKQLTIDDQSINLISEQDPRQLPWAELGVDLVLECSGRFTTRKAAQAHLDAGAKKVLISAPATDVDKTIVFGVNHETLTATDQIISNASCTTNCLAPMAKVLHEQFGIVSGVMTTIHAFTNDQSLNDVYHEDLRRARSATQSMIPTKTGAAQAVGLVLPSLTGKLDGMAVRVPTLNVSLVDFSFIAEKPVGIDQINGAIRKACYEDSHQIMKYNLSPLVSCDFNHESASCIFDATQTKVVGNLVKVMAWYDNEWGFSNRMLDVAHYLNAIQHGENSDRAYS